MILVFLYYYRVLILLYILVILHCLFLLFKYLYLTIIYFIFFFFFSYFSTFFFLSYIFLSNTFILFQLIIFIVIVWSRYSPLRSVLCFWSQNKAVQELLWDSQRAERCFWRRPEESLQKTGVKFHPDKNHAPGATEAFKGKDVIRLLWLQCNLSAVTVCVFINIWNMNSEWFIRTTHIKGIVHFKLKFVIYQLTPRASKM